MVSAARTREYTKGQISGQVWVGIDPSLTGFSVSAVDSRGGYASWVYTSNLKGVERMLAIEAWLKTRLEIIGKDRIMDVAIEAPVIRTMNATNAGMLHGMLQRVIYQELGHLKPLVVPPMSLKKYTSGTGKAEKSLMLKSVYQRWDADLDDDNAADSYALARFVMKSPGTKEQEAVMMKIHQDPKHRA